MFDLWIILDNYSWIIFVLGGILAMLVGVTLVLPRKTRRVGLVILVVGATLLCAGILRAWHRQNVVMSIARAHQKVHNGMTKAEVQALLGVPDLIASADPTGKLQVPWESRRDLDIPDAVLAWEYRPYGGLHLYRVYFDDDGRVMGKAAD